MQVLIFCLVLLTALKRKMWKVHYWNQCKYKHDDIWNTLKISPIYNYLQKQLSGSVILKSGSENMEQIYRKTPTWKSDFNKVALQLY